jgi:putative spermidine/putrescine transport system permease protein
MADRLVRLGGRIAVIVFYLILLAPILVVVPVSFNPEPLLSLPTAAPSLRWYVAILHDTRILSTLATSVRLGLVVTAVALATGFGAALVVERGRFPGRGVLAMLFTLPLMLPAVVLGLGLLLVLVQFGLLGTFAGLVMAHLIVVLPYVIRLLINGIRTMPQGLEDAATSLGAGRVQVLVFVTLPLMRNALVAAGALAFLTSFDEATISLFLTGPNISTLPVTMFDYAGTHPDPTIAAMSVLLLAATFAIIVLVDSVAGLSRMTR